jgi:peroxiredoxin
MGSALLVLRVLLACVFALAGVAKLADLPGSRVAAVGFGVPERLAGVVGLGLPVCELAVAVLLLPAGSARFGALGALLLLLAFVVAISVALARGNRADCHCFGQLHSAPIGWRTLVRNGLLAAAAGFVLGEGWHHAGASAVGWIDGLNAGWAVALVLGVVLAFVIGFLVWFSLQLLSQNGRVLARLEGLESAVAGLSEPRSASRAEVPVVLGEGLKGAGLAVGAAAPDFDLASVDGSRASLGSLLTPGRLLVLVFSDSGCGPCNALLPEIAGWQREHAERLAVAVIASGDQKRNREKAARHGLERVLVQPGREVSGEYKAHGTPTAVVVSPDRLIASPAVGGADAIRTLVAQAATRILPATVANGKRNGSASPQRPSARARIGELAPALTLDSLDGERVLLPDVYGARAVAVFWNPGCGFCRRMVPDLRAFEDGPPADSPRVLVISRGEPERLREHGLRSLVLLDPEGDVARAFGAAGTPTGVLVVDGRIASPVAAGAEAVFALADAHAGVGGVLRG